MNVNSSSLFRGNSLGISYLQTGFSDTLQDGWVHRKVVPFTIIAQPLSGFYSVTCADKTVTVKPGETALIPSNTDVSFEHHASGGSVMRAQWIHINWKLFGSVDVTRLLEVPLKVGSRQNREFGDVIEEMAAMGQTDPLNLSPLSRTYELGFVLLRLLLDCSKRREEAGEYLSRTSRLQPVFEFVNANLDESITIEQLAKIAFLSPSRFFALFKGLMSISPMEYVRQERLSEASRLLLSTALSIGQIASATGFINQFHFSRIFKAQFGLSPREYRKQPG
jgi:AraC-like DNA-binding protein